MKKIFISMFFFLIGMFPVYAENIAPGDSVIPIGTLQSYSGNTIPSGYLEANGQAVSRTTYKELFAVIGTLYGTGDNSTTFNLPNLNGRVIVGIDSTQTEFDAIGEKGGEKTHKLTVNEMPSHTHTFTGASHTHEFVGTSATTSSADTHTHPIPALSGTTNTTGNHTHIVSRRTSTYGSGIQDGWRAITAPASANGDWNQNSSTEGAGNHNHTFTIAASTTGAAGNHTHTVTAAGTISSTTTSGSNANTGGNQAHNNLQPYIVLKYIIRAK